MIITTEQKIKNYLISETNLTGDGIYLDYCTTTYEYFMELMGIDISDGEHDFDEILSTITTNKIVNIPNEKFHDIIDCILDSVYNTKYIVLNNFLDLAR